MQLPCSFLPSESAEKLLDRWPEDNLMRYLLNRIDAPNDRFSGNKISVITLNSDQSLELTMIESTRHRHNCSMAIANKVVMDHFPIIHVYGKLSSPDLDAPDFVPYGEDKSGINQGWMYKTACDVRIIDDSRNSSSDFDDTKKLLAVAEAVCFLGFSFDKTNSERLGGAAIGAGGRVTQTGGMGEFAIP